MSNNQVEKTVIDKLYDETSSELGRLKNDGYRILKLLKTRLHPADIENLKRFLRLQGKEEVLESLL